MGGSSALTRWIGAATAFAALALPGPSSASAAPVTTRFRFFAFACFDKPRGDDGLGRPEPFRCPRKRHPSFGDFR